MQWTLRAFLSALPKVLSGFFVRRFDGCEPRASARFCVSSSSTWPEIGVPNHKAIRAIRSFLRDEACSMPFERHFFYYPHEKFLRPSRPSSDAYRTSHLTAQLCIETAPRHGLILRRSMSRGTFCEGFAHNETRPRQSLRALPRNTILLCKNNCFQMRERT